MVVAVDVVARRGLFQAVDFGAKASDLLGGGVLRETASDPFIQNGADLS